MSLVSNVLKVLGFEFDNEPSNSAADHGKHETKWDSSTEETELHKDDRATVAADPTTQEKARQYLIDQLKAAGEEGIEIDQLFQLAQQQGEIPFDAIMDAYTALMENRRLFEEGSKVILKGASLVEPAYGWPIWLLHVYPEEGESTEDLSAQLQAAVDNSSILPTVVNAHNYVAASVAARTLNDAIQTVREALTSMVYASIKVQANDPIQKNVTVAGLTIAVEWPAGSLRKYKDGYQKLMQADYGYLRNTTGADGEEWDCYVGPNKNSKRVVKIEQLKDDGSYDEDKFILGCDSTNEAVNLYLAHMPEDKLGAVAELSIDEFKKQLSAHMEEEKETSKAAAFAGRIEEALATARTDFLKNKTKWSILRMSLKKMYPFLTTEDLDTINQQLKDELATMSLAIEGADKTADHNQWMQNSDYIWVKYDEPLFAEIELHPSIDRYHWIIGKSPHAAWLAGKSESYDQKLQSIFQDDIIRGSADTLEGAQQMVDAEFNRIFDELKKTSSLRTTAQPRFELTGVIRKGDTGIVIDLRIPRSSTRHHDLRQLNNFLKTFVADRKTDIVSATKPQIDNEVTVQIDDSQVEFFPNVSDDFIDFEVKAEVIQSAPVEEDIETESSSWSRWSSQRQVVRGQFDSKSNQFDLQVGDQGRQTTSYVDAVSFVSKFAAAIDAASIVTEMQNYPDRQIEKLVEPIKTEAESLMWAVNPEGGNCEQCLANSGKSPEETTDQIPLHDHCKCEWVTTAALKTASPSTPKPTEPAPEGSEWVWDPQQNMWTAVMKQL